MCCRISFQRLYKAGGTVFAAGLTAVYFEDEDNDEHRSLTMFYKNSYDDIISGKKQKVFMSQRYSVGQNDFTELFDDKNVMFFEYSFDDDGVCVWRDGNENVYLERTDYEEYTDRDGNVYTNRADAWNYLLSVEPRLEYVEASDYNLGD